MLHGLTPKSPKNTSWCGRSAIFYCWIWPYHVLLCYAFLDWSNFRKAQPETSPMVVRIAMDSWQILISLQKHVWESHSIRTFFFACPFYSARWWLQSCLNFSWKLYIYDASHMICIRRVLFFNTFHPFLPPLLDLGRSTVPTYNLPVYLLVVVFSLSSSFFHCCSPIVTWQIFQCKSFLILFKQKYGELVTFEGPSCENRNGKFQSVK